MKRMACVLALTTGAALGVGANPASAEKIVTPAGGNLQLTVNAAGTVTTDAPLALDVRFEGGTLRVVELLVDGVSIKKKNLATRKSQGHLEFQMEAGILTEGTHDIVIKAQDADGNTATTTTQIKVMPGTSGLVKFQFPRNKAMVQGVVPIEIKLDASIRNPYVTFFIDDNFLSLTNYAPFTVNWDSARVANGPHTVSVEVYDDSLAKIKSTSLHINVNNPGGLTTRQKDTPDLGHSIKINPVQSATTGITDAVDASRYSAVPRTNLTFRSPDETVSRLMNPQAGTTILRSSAPRGMEGTSIGNNQNRVAASVRPVSPFAPSNKTSEMMPNVSTTDATKHITGSNALANLDRGTPAEVRTRVKVGRIGLMGLVSVPGEFTALQAPTTEGRRLARATFRPRRAGNMAARPALKMEGSESIAAHSSALSNTIKFSPLAPTVTKSLRSIKPITKVAPIHIVGTNRALFGPGAISGKGRSFQIAFDNTRLGFDVTPRVERGMPLAPFRQIFEHTGGTIQWFNQSKTLRAFNSTREIEFKVGEDEAKVNNQMVKMEAKTYIEKGRTIVPLSFVRDSLDVNVTYDAATGHIRIESKK